MNRALLLLRLLPLLLALLALYFAVKAHFIGSEWGEKL